MDRGSRIPRRQRRLRWALLAFSLGTLFGGLAGWEARRERLALEAVVRAEGEALAEALGHAVENASASSREIEELASARVLDVARLLARLDEGHPLEPSEIAGAADDLALQRVVLLDADLAATASFPPGAPLPASWSDAVRALARGEADEVVFPTAGPADAPAFGAAVRRPRGGAIVAAMDGSEMLAFADETGAAHLLAAVAGTGGIVYAVLEDRTGATIASERAVTPEPNVMEIARSVHLGGEGPGRLRVGVSTAAVHATGRSALRRAAITAGTVFVLVAAVGAALAGRRRAREEREAREREARRGESLAALGRLAATVAHEVRNPLNAIAVGIQRLEREYPPGPGGEGQARLTRLVRDEVARLDGIVTRFLQMARPPDLRPAEGSLDDALREAAPLLTAGAPGGVHIDVRPGGADRAFFDAGAFRQIVLNLVWNARDAVGETGRITVETRAEGDHAVLEVVDDGPGIPPADRERIFEFGYSTKPDGTGLGLPTVERLAAEMGGSVSVDRLPDRGTVFRVTFPVGPHLRSRR
jgi:signal transduction histidine kinase